MFIVYVLKSRGGLQYTGHTDNLDRRLHEHRNGLCKTTKADSDWHVVHTEEFPSRGEAMAWEKWLKTGRGREYLKGILNPVVASNSTEQTKREGGVPSTLRSRSSG